MWPLRWGCLTPWRHTQLKDREAQQRPACNGAELTGTSPGAVSCSSVWPSVTNTSRDGQQLQGGAVTLPVLQTPVMPSLQVLWNTSKHRERLHRIPTSCLSLLDPYSSRGGDSCGAAHFIDETRAQQVLPEAIWLRSDGHQCRGYSHPRAGLD